jgi:hypothetical protein
MGKQLSPCATTRVTHRGEAGHGCVHNGRATGTLDRELNRFIDDGLAAA